MNRPSVAPLWVPSGGAGELRREVACAAQSDMPILITGEDADDNRAVAEAIHRRSRRAAAPFVAIDCADMPESALEARLFGCVSADGVIRSACGCFERAHCGTLFIAHVDAMSVRLQTLLLQFLEDGDIRRVGDVPVHRKVDVRVVTSGDGSLFARLPHISFNEDLFYRLNVMHLVIPRSSRLRDVVPRQPADTSLHHPGPIHRVTGAH